MALSGLHVVCGPVATVNGASLMVSPAWSQTLANAGTTSRGAPAQGYLMQVTASVDAWFAIGATPDASQASGEGQTARSYVAAGTTREVFCGLNDKLAWIAA